MATQRLASSPVKSLIHLRGSSTHQTQRHAASKAWSSAKPPLSAAAVSSCHQRRQQQEWLSVPLSAAGGDDSVSRRWKSDSAPSTIHNNPDAEASGGYVTTKSGYRKRIDPLDLTFLNHEAAFKSKTSWEVLRAYIVFQLCSIKPLVQHNEKLMKLGQQVLGKPLFGAIMKQTFYGQFVAGEDQERIKPVIHRMHTFGVKSILDYSVEEDISEEQAMEKELKGAIGEKESLEDFQKLQHKGTHEDQIKRYKAHKSQSANRKHKLTGARTYFYENEASCEKNMETFLRCIEAVSDSTHGTGFSAIKMTALGRPSLLLQLSEVIVRARRYYQSISGKDGFVQEGNVSKDAFEKRFKEKVSYDKLDASPETKEWLDQMTFDKKGLIHLFSWSGLIDSKLLMKDVFQVPNLQTGKLEPMVTALTDEEEEQFKNMLTRLNTVFQAAKDLDVRVMVDAEQTYFQPAIHRIAMEMQKKFNTEKAIVFNTYQCYLKIAHNSLVLDLEQAKRQNFHFGAKLVRGAYMIQERERALDLGYEDPINPDYEATSDMYHKCLSECMDRMAELKTYGDGREQRIGIMVASHNADTIRFAIQKMKDLGIKPEDRLICFGQLLGMCDNLSFPLGQAGYSVYKYVPYGPVNEVLPYLSRRAHENQGLLTKLQTEKNLLRKELFRRVTRGQLSRSKGEYLPVGFENINSNK